MKTRPKTSSAPLVSSLVQRHWHRVTSRCQCCLQRQAACQSLLPPCEEMTRTTPLHLRCWDFGTLTLVLNHDQPKLRRTHLTNCAFSRDKCMLIGLAQYLDVFGYVWTWGNAVYFLENCHQLIGVNHDAPDLQIYIGLVPSCPVTFSQQAKSTKLPMISPSGGRNFDELDGYFI